MRTLISAFLLIASCVVSTAYASVMYFTPSGTSTVSQGANLWWDITSSVTSTSGPVGPVDFYLSDHGDIHHNASGVDMIDVVGASDAGVDLTVGTIIGPGTNFGETTSFTGTTGFGGGCPVGNTCIYGLTFQLAGQTHYGWVEFFEGASTQGLNAWAYETTPRLAIRAGEGAVPLPATLLLIGLGLAGLGYSRRNHG